MATDFLARCEILEEAYEFMLGYAGQGFPSEEGSQIRYFLQRAITALTGLAESCANAATRNNLEPATMYQAFVSVLYRDAQNALAVIEVVLAQPSISSQLIDNLNASIHLRALLTDLFLVGEIFRSQMTPEVPEAVNASKKAP